MTAVRGKPAFGIWNGYAPASGPKAMPYTFDFSDTTLITDNLLDENTRGIMQFVQGMYVDNFDNPTPFVITFDVTAQRIVVPANSCGTFPVLAPDQTGFRATQSQGTIVYVQFLNVPTAWCIWGPVTVNTVPVAPASGNLSGGGIALSGVSEILLAANVNRLGYIIENPPANVNSIWINFGVGNPAAADQTSFEISPGGYFPPNGGFVFSTEQINVVGTPGDLVVAKEFV